MHIGIIGAGHAGVEAARAAREAGAEVTLFSDEDVLPYYRPRLVAVAFGQAEQAVILLRPADWYAAQGINLQLKSPVEALNLTTRTVEAGGVTRTFDGLVVATGAQPVLPPFAREGSLVVWPLWNAGHAHQIRSRVRPGGRIVVVGGGILGIEAALRALDVGMEVTIVELMDRLMPAQFGARASAVLLRRLQDRHIHVILGHAIKSVAADPQTARLTLDDGHTLEAELCLVSIGSRPDTSLAVQAGLDTERGITTDHFLQTRFAGCFAAGDAIQIEGLTRCSMKEATTQGKVAATNLVAFLQGRSLQFYQAETSPLSFRAKDFEIYSIGHPGGVGYEDHLLEGSTESVIRTLVIKDGIPLGVQMIGSREGFDDYAAAVKRGHAAGAAHAGKVS